MGIDPEMGVSRTHARLGGLDLKSARMFREGCCCRSEASSIRSEQVRAYDDRAWC